MEPDRWPLDRAVTCERVRDAVRNLDEASEEDCLVLLSDLLRAVWGSITAQNQ